MDYWQVDCTKGNPNTTGGLFEIYDGSGDVFQYLYLPAPSKSLKQKAAFRLTGICPEQTKHRFS